VTWDGGAGSGYDRSMLLARLEPWHWWIGVIFTILVVLTVFGMVGNYLQKVVRPQYPSRRQRPRD